MTDKCPGCALVSSVVLSLASLVAVTITVVIVVIQFRDIDQRIDDLEDVAEDLPQICSLNPDPGPCSSKIERYARVTRLFTFMDFIVH